MPFSLANIARRYYFNSSANSAQQRDIGIVNLHLLESFLRDRRARGCRPKTIQFYREQLRPFLLLLQGRGINTGRISAHDVREYIICELDRGLSKHSVNCRIRAIRAFFAFLYESGELDYDPSKRIRLVPTTRRPVPILPTDEIERLLNYFDRSTFLGARNYTLTVLLLDSMIRCGEAVRLSVSDFQRHTATIYVRDTKTHEDASVPLSDDATALLCSFLDHWRSKLPGDRIFCNKHGDPITPNAVGQMFRKAKKKLGISGRLYAHLLRHTGASTMVMNGASLTAVQRILRHSSITTTMKYVHPDYKFIADQHRKYGPWSKT